MGVSLGLNGTEKIDMPNHKDPNPTDMGYSQEHSETQLQTDRVAGICQRKRWVSLGFWTMRRI